MTAYAEHTSDLVEVPRDEARTQPLPRNIGPFPSRRHADDWLKGLGGFFGTWWLQELSDAGSAPPEAADEIDGLELALRPERTEVTL